MERVFFFFNNCDHKIADDRVDFEVPWLYNEAVSDA